MHILVPLAVPVAALSLLVACQSSQTVSAQRCDPQRHQVLVGQNIGAVTLPASLPQRIISPGDRLSEGDRPDRLNIFVDPKGWIARVSCG